MHEGHAHPLEHCLLMLTDLLATPDLTTPREKAVEKAEALRGAAMANVRPDCSTGRKKEREILQFKSYDSNFKSGSR